MLIIDLLLYKERHTHYLHFLSYYFKMNKKREYKIIHTLALY